jgi:hypothetical protein
LFCVADLVEFLHDQLCDGLGNAAFHEKGDGRVPGPLVEEQADRVSADLPAADPRADDVDRENGNDRQKQREFLFIPRQLAVKFQSGVSPFPCTQKKRETR